MDKVNYSTVAQSIVQTLMAYEISFMDVFTFHSDNAAYMKKCFTDVLAGLMPKCTHITCYSHILDLVARSITQHFPAALKYMKYMNNLFAIPSGRKARFLQYISTIKSRDPNVPLKLPPEPVETRWNTYFEAARYHASNMKYHKAFIDSEIGACDNSSTKYLLLLKEILHIINQMRKLQIQMSFLADKSEKLSKLLDHFQSHKPTALDTHDKVEELQLYLDTNCFLKYESCSVYFDNKGDMPLETKLELTGQFNKVFNDASMKLHKYICDRAQPGQAFLKALRILDPCKVPLLSSMKEDYSSLPMWDTVPESEFEQYIKLCAPGYEKTWMVNQMTLHSSGMQFIPKCQC
nr:PREDICTED: uncharacterized protein LOC106706949 [Latimeria chalumnae]|eukprot:XP_014354088.1 PREDICTED: uncharacterized protein LOC106706949 [Latimeria chalumnae]